MVDWLLFGLWAGLLFAVVMLTSGGNPTAFSGPGVAQLVGFIAVTLPFTLYFALTEASAKQGSVGKRVFGLQVETMTGKRLSMGSALLRSAIKFLPWEIGHFVAQQSFYSTGAEFSTWLWLPAFFALGLPVLWIISLLTSGMTPYDRLSQSRVSRK